MWALEKQRSESSIRKWTEIVGLPSNCLHGYFSEIPEILTEFSIVLQNASSRLHEDRLSSQAFLLARRAHGHARQELLLTRGGGRAF